MTHTPRKRFGQHFLCDQAVVSRIIQAIAPKSSDAMIEIGPGQGAITLPLLRSVRFLRAIELDRDLLTELDERTRHVGRLEIISQDALKVDFASLKTDARLLRIVGNLPYNISTPLLFHLLEYAAVIEDMVFMLQKEVAERIAAVPGDDQYGRLSVMTQYHALPQVLFTIGPEAFYPPPKVQSAMIHLTPHKKLPFIANDYPTFAKVVLSAFSQRRKTLRNSLKKLIPANVWEELNISSSLRPEELGVKEFVALSNAIITEESEK